MRLVKLTLFLNFEERPTRERIRFRQILLDTEDLLSWHRESVDRRGLVHAGCLHRKQRRLLLRPSLLLQAEDDLWLQVKILHQTGLDLAAVFIVRLVKVCVLAVRLLMRRQVARLGEAAAAAGHGTNVRALAGVSSEMRPQVEVERESLSADLTLVGLLAGVDKLMPLQLRIVEEALAAALNRANVLLFGVRRLVLPEVGWVVKLLLAVFDRALENLIPVDAGQRVIHVHVQLVGKLRFRHTFGRFLFHPLTEALLIHQPLLLAHK